MNTKMKAEKTIYFDLMLTLVPIAFMSYSYYGIRTLILCIIAMVTCLITDYICILLGGKKFKVEDLDSVVTGMIIALMMPASISYNILMLTCFVSIIIGKQAFGGRRNLVFSPAAVGFIFSSISWKNHVMLYPRPYSELEITSTVSNTLYPSLSSIINTTETVNVSDTDLMLGNFMGPMGATSIIVLLVCGAVLMFRKSISTMTALGTIGTITTYSFLFPVGNSPIKYTLYQLIGNMVVFGTIYISADLRITPNSKIPRLIYGIIIGFFTCYLTRELKVENAIIYATIIACPLAMAMDDYTARVKARLNKFYIEKIQPEIQKARQKLSDKLRNSGENDEIKG
ncbi:MAG: hypothetical protein GX286_07580 [Clostridiales bacterium]|nr:hypothetical protein [Clostridiales bacterium]